MKILVPATSANLGPGFDTLGLALEFFNEVEIKPFKVQTISINGEGCNKPFLKKNNNFVNIFNEIFLELTGKRENFKFKFKNFIPFSRGLGSSSAVIVSAVASAYKMANFKVDKHTTLNKSLIYENHPDNITPATFGGFSCSIINNNKVLFKKCDISSDIKAVVVIPSKSMGTKESRSKLPKKYTTLECVNNISHASFLTACFFTKQYDSLRYACKDMLHEDIRMKALPELFEVRNLAYENGAIMSALSGSGSSFLNIVHKDDANKFKKLFINKFPNFRVEIFSFQNDGIIIN